MAEVAATPTFECSHCPYKTPSEENMHRHILARECQAGSFSYKVKT